MTVTRVADYRVVDKSALHKLAGELVHLWGGVDLTQHRAARRMGVSDRTLSALLRGQRPGIDESTVRALRAAIYGRRRALTRKLGREGRLEIAGRLLTLMSDALRPSAVEDPDALEQECADYVDRVFNRPGPFWMPEGPRPRAPRRTPGARARPLLLDGCRLERAPDGAPKEPLPIFPEIFADVANPPVLRTNVAIWRRDDYRILMGHLSTIPKIAEVIAAFRAECDRQKVSAARILVGVLRVIEPLLDPAIGKLGLSHWTEISVQETLYRVIRRGIRNERARLKLPSAAKLRKQATKRRRDAEAKRRRTGATRRWSPVTAQNALTRRAAAERIRADVYMRAGGRCECGEPACGHPFDSPQLNKAGMLLSMPPGASRPEVLYSVRCIESLVIDPFEPHRWELHRKADGSGLELSNVTAMCQTCFRRLHAARPAKETEAAGVHRDALGESTRGWHELSPVEQEIVDRLGWRYRRRRNPADVYPSATELAERVACRDPDLGADLEAALIGRGASI